MARSRNGGGERAPSVAVELLESDHRNVEAMFEQYESEKESDDGTKRDIALRICGELTVHAQVEEELFYPWLRENLDEEEMELLEEAYVEHSSAKDLIAQIEASADIGPEFDAKVKVLSEYVKHHVNEEENEIFPAIRDMEEELDELGQEMHARKAELMAEMGLEAPMGEDEEEMEEGETGEAGRGMAGRRSQQSEHRRAR